MKRSLLALPPVLLLTVLSSTSSALADSYELVKNTDDISQQNENVQSTWAPLAPVAVRKMQPGEMWLPQYWKSDDQGAAMLPSIPSLRVEGDNTSMAMIASPPIHLHNDDTWDATYARLWPRYELSRRSYQCPTGTNNCTNIDKPNSCCAAGEVCMLLNNGVGTNDVGCCPSGATCGGSVGSCNTAANYTYCAGGDGGCCIPGYQCDDVGCIASGTTTITTSGSPIVVIMGSTSTTTTIPNSSGTTTTLTSTTTVTPSTITPSVTTVYSTTTTPTSTTTINLSVSTATSITVQTVTASPAVLATSMSANLATSLSTTTIAPAASCPTGYYQCSAFVQQCCQIGYGCFTSTCLQTSSSTTIIAGNVVTIIVVTGSGVSTVTGGATSNAATSGSSTIAATTTTSGSVHSTSTATISTTFLGSGMCATGWYGCAASDGGGCCPLGYSCAASCIATQTGEPGRVYKVPTSKAANRTVRKSHLTYALALVVAISMMTL